MKTLAKTTLSTLSLSLALAFSAGAMADGTDKHYSDRYDRYENRDSRYDDYQSDRRYNQYRPEYSRIVKAKVTDVDPIYRSVRGEPVAEQQCYREPRSYSRSDRKAGKVLGAVIGGVIGYNAGGKHRHNKRSGAAVGAVLGSVIGGEAAKNKRHSREYCETVYSGGYQRQELVGYNVKYKYKGQRFETFMDYRPGRYIDVRLSAVPVRR